MIHTVIKTASTARLGRSYLAAARFVVTALFCTSLLAAPSVAQTAPALAGDVITSATPSAQKIDEFMGAAVLLLKSEKPPEQEAGRNAIITIVTPAANQPQPSAAFKFTYSEKANAQLLPLAKHPNWRVRLNAIIAAEKVAEKTGNENLMPTVRAFLPDSNEGVALWAVKASKHVAAKKSADIMPPLIAAVKRFPSVASAAYQALDSDPPKLEFVPAVQELLETRIALYAQGTPPVPTAEKIGINYLVKSASWNGQTPQQQTRTAQILVNLTAAVNRQLKPDMSNDEKDEMAEVMRSVLKGIETIGWLDSSKASLAASSKEIQKSIPTRAAPVTSIQLACTKVYPLLKTVFSGITEPAVAATNPSSADASASGGR